MMSDIKKADMNSRKCCKMIDEQERWRHVFVMWPQRAKGYGEEEDNSLETMELVHHHNISTFI